LRKDRAGQEAELPALAFVDRDADNVGGQQVAGELDAREGKSEQSRQRMGQRRLADAGQILDQQVAAGEQAGNGLADFVILAEDDPAGCRKDGRWRAAWRSAREVWHRTSRASGKCHCKPF